MVLNGGEWCEMVCKGVGLWWGKVGNGVEFLGNVRYCVK